MNDKNHQTWGSNSKVVQRTQHPKLEQRVQNGILSKEKRASISSSFPSLQMCVDNVNTNFSDLPLGKPLTRFSVVSRYCKRLKMNMLYLYTYAYIYTRIYFDIYDESCLFTFSIHKTLWYSKSQRKPLCLGWWIHKAKWQQIFDLSAERTDESAYVSTKHVYHHLSLKRILNNDVEGVCIYIYISYRYKQQFCVAWSSAHSHFPGTPYPKVEMIVVMSS